MSCRIFNRDFEHPADGWYQIEAKGEHANKAAGVVQVIDDPAITSIVNRFNAAANAGQLSHGSEMLIDVEHFKHDQDKETRAYGWLQQLQARGNGIYGRIRWTTTGQPAVDGGDYRFFSTEYNPEDLEVLNSASPRRVRPLALDGLTLTNMPNNQGQKPITNRGAAAIEPPSIHPELDEWFKTVRAVQASATRHTNTAMGFNRAWDIAKQVHPEKHSAAFNPLIAATQKDFLQGPKAISEIANRVDEATGYGTRYGRGFVHEKLPELLTAMRAAVGNDATHLANGELDPVSPAAAAARTFNRLVGEEVKRDGISISTAFARVSNREPVLKSLASGDITAEQAFNQEPALRNRLS
ncbi:MAG TPA: phage protease [Verrucomicrobiae bacterium]|nr:phage protease [Verrucomicrobiae bacterium]